MRGEADDEVIELVPFLRERMRQIEDKYVLCELGRLEREESDVYPPPRAADFLAYPGDEDDYEHEEPEEIGRVNQLPQDPVVDTHEDEHREKPYAEIYGMAYKEIIRVPVHLERVDRARAVNHEDAHRRQKRGREDNPNIVTATLR